MHNFLKCPVHSITFPAVDGVEQVFPVLEYAIAVERVVSVSNIRELGGVPGAVVHGPVEARPVVECH